MHAAENRPPLRVHCEIDSYGVLCTVPSKRDAIHAPSLPLGGGGLPVSEKGKKKKESKPKRSKPLKVSNQIPPKRRREIERALDAHEPSRPDWDRLVGAKQHRFFGKRIKPGTIRQIELPLQTLLSNPPRTDFPISRRLITKFA